MTGQQPLILKYKKWQLLLPAILGLGVVFYLIWKNFDEEAFAKITWNQTTIFFIALCIVIYILRHLAYSWRLKMVTDHFFSWKKSIQLIFLWEFASAISPTALGGSATAMILLSQESLKASKAITMILYTVILDTLFFLISLPLAYFLIGPHIIRPHITSFWDSSGFGVTFIIVWCMMFLYGSFFFYGLFIRPEHIKKTLSWLASLKWLKRFETRLKSTGENMLIASSELKVKKFGFHVKAWIATALAWTFRFTIIPLLIFGLIQQFDFNVSDFILLWARYESMFTLTAFSPTPGGSGVAEALFGGFFVDFIRSENAFIIAMIWRLITYYSYLVLGMIILPQWIAGIIEKRQSKIQTS